MSEGSTLLPSPVIAIDSREQRPLTFRNLKSVVIGLKAGDYSFIGGQRIFAVERKSLDDLAQCCSGGERDRFSEQLHRLAAYPFRRLLILGSPAQIEAHQYASKILPKSVLHTVYAFEVRFGIPVAWEPCPERAAELVERWSVWQAREIIQTAGHLEECCQESL